MQLTIDKIFLVLGVLSIPNLFFRGQYNVPLMLFCFACWQPNNQPFILYSLIFSWCVDAYLLLDYVTKGNQQQINQTSEKATIIIIISIIVFVAKIISIVYLIITHKQCTRALSCSYIYENLKSLGNFNKKD